MSQEGEEPGFGLTRPPLHVTIKQILDKYPDGQIFKVCSYCVFCCCISCLDCLEILACVKSNVIVKTTV